ncbi:hypothetical protein Adt_32145 [Abeliophyllum distichum]|uniref:Uncharacterized protein n=1 Tax=Abeliophyllum distichum TaxID=126358 RepID=A0ABD1RJT6_9LAMI
MSNRSKRYKSSTSVKLVEIVELSSSESDVPDDKVEGVEEVEGDKTGIEGMENERENAGVDGKLENDGNDTGVPEGAYVLEFSENADCNIKVEWEVFLNRHQEFIRNS